MELRDDNLRKFQNDWDRALLVVPEQLNESFLETLYRRQVAKSKQFEQSLTMYNLETVQKGTQPSYSRLYAMVVAYLNDKRIQKNVGPRQGSANAARQGSQTGDCRQFYKTGKCSRTSCPYKHDNTIAEPAKGKGKGKKGKGKESVADASPRRGRSETREGSPASSRNSSGQKTRGTSPSGEANRPQCWKYMKGKCSDKN